jgi:hypothetical protein
MQKMHASDKRMSWKGAMILGMDLPCGWGWVGMARPQATGGVAPFRVPKKTRQYASIHLAQIGAVVRMMSHQET